ncbi:MAG TPA: serine/threonine-protein kinase [Gemmataceae bacterium]|nr:serine/threonine-protein kinase [Gemmataceae bacterium]
MTPDKMRDPSIPATPGDSAPAPGISGGAVPRLDTLTGGPRTEGSGALSQVWVGKSLGKYQVTGVLGQGGMALVLKGYDPTIEREVAIKILADHLASDPTALPRFLAEARAAGKLNHPNVVGIYEVCQQDQTHYLVLEYVPGGSLNDRLADQGALAVLEATQVLIDACKGVGAAHAAGLIHRDIKPANLMRAADGSIKVADFGLAKGGSTSGRHLTQTGMAVGTPYFMSPEQCESKPVDHRSDLYSLGATYYSLLTCQHPFADTEGVPQLMYMHCYGPIPDPRSVNPAIPQACSQIVARAMAKAPAERYQSTSEMLADLQAVAAALSGQAPITLPSGSRPIPATLPAAPRPRFPIRREARREARHSPWVATPFRRRRTADWVRRFPLGAVEEHSR